MVMKSKVEQYGFGETSTTTVKRTKERFRTKGRSSQTYKNKIREMKKLYKRLYKASEKKKGKNPQGKYFCDKYTTCASFLKVVKIKEPNKEKK